MRTNQSIPFFLVAGFLGSGKTTLIRRFLAAHAPARRVLVVQNEFAESGVDARELRSTGLPFEMIEVQGGSVFCVCRLAEFRRGLAELLRNQSLDAVILEATGLADPLSIVQMLAAPELQGRVCLRHIWCVADARNFTRMADTVRCVRHQVRVADTVIINHVEQAGAETLELISRRVRELNPLAAVETARYCDVDVRPAFHEFSAETVAQRRALENARVPPAGRLPSSALVLRSHRPVPRAAAEAFLQDWAPRLWRMKGYLLLAGPPAADGAAALAVQAAAGVLQTASLREYDGGTELVLLAESLDEPAVRAEFAGLAGASI